MIIGSAIKLESTTSIQGDSASITIIDPNEVVKVNEQAMSDIGSLTYQYIWQSANTDTPGEYCARISVVKGVYTARSIEKFTLNPQCTQ